MILSSAAFAKDSIKDSCEIAVAKNAPSRITVVAGVEAPVEEPAVKPATTPAPAQPRTPQRNPVRPAQPRRAPDPRPDREVRPTKDPKNLDPISFFKVKGFPTDLLPADVVALFRQRFDQEKLGLQQSLKTVGLDFSNDPRNAFQALGRLEQEISKSEAGRHPEIVAFVKELMQDEFGRNILASFSRIDIGQQAMNEMMIDTPVGPQAKPRKSILDFFGPGKKADKKNQAPGNPQANQPANPPVNPAQAKPEAAAHALTQWEIIRRECYNMLAAAWGWKGSEALLWKDSQASMTRFPELYLPWTQFHFARRYADLLHFADEFSKKGVPGSGGSAKGGAPHAQGQECVTCKGQRVKDEFGDAFIELGDVKATAVGTNAWVLAHEGFKAAFQIRTALEATPRMTLTDEGRAQLRALELGPQNEFRQLLFGRYFETQWAKILGALVHKKFQRSLSSEDYFTLTERIFSYDMNVFKSILEKAFAPTFYDDPDAIDEVVQVLGDYLIFDGLNGEDTES